MGDRSEDRAERAERAAVDKYVRAVRRAAPRAPSAEQVRVVVENGLFGPPLEGDGDDDTP